MFRTPTVVLTTLAALAVPAAADVITVDLHVDTLQDVIDAAASGDTILIVDGPSSTVETAVINGKGLTLIGDDQTAFGPPHAVLRRLAIRNLPAGESVTITRLDVSGPGGDALILTNNAGPVRFVDVRAEGGEGLVEMAGQPAVAGHAGASISDCADVAFVKCGLTGGHGGNVASHLATDSSDGGPGLEVVNSTVTLFSSGARGGRGGLVDIIFSPPGGAGGPGATLHDSTLRLHDSGFTGGDGGEFDWSGTGTVTGGDGLVQTGASLTVTRDATFAGGEGYFAPDGVDTDIQGGQLVAYPDAMGRFEFYLGERVVREGEDITVSFRELVSGTQFFVLMSLEPGFIDLPARQGVLLFDAPFASNLLFVGTSPAFSFNNLVGLGPAPELPAGLGHVDVMVQCIEIPPGGTALLGDVDQLTLLDSEL